MNNRKHDDQREPARQRLRIRAQALSALTARLRARTLSTIAAALRTVAQTLRAGTMHIIRMTGKLRQNGLPGIRPPRFAGLKAVSGFHKVITGTAAAGVLGTFYLVSLDHKPQAVQQPLVIPAGSPYKELIAAAGIIEADTENIKVGCTVPGIARRIFVTAGQTVQADDPLFTLDNRRAMADLAICESHVAQSQAREAEAAARDRLAQQRFKVADDVKDKGAISREEYLNRKNEAAIAKAVLATAKADVKAAKAQLDQAKTDLELLTVRAPLTSRVLQINLHTGEYAPVDNPPNPPVVLGRADLMHVRIDIDEHEAWKYRPGAKAVMFLKGNPKISFELEFKYLEPYVVPKVSLTGAATERVDTRVLQVVYGFAPAQEPVYIGQQVDVFIETGTGSDASGSCAPPPCEAKEKRL